MKKLKFQSPTGMHDILPEQQKYFKKIYDIVSSVADFYGFGKIDTPILENIEIFARGTGETTDIVKKEMYVLKTKGGDILALRPELTPSIVRAYIEHGMFNLPQPVKLWYFGPVFRYEHPQAGRYRQFWQFGFEVLGDKSPVIDAQIIQIIYNILSELKIKNLIIEINSIGDGQCRPYYKKILTNYFRNREQFLCSDCKKRLKENVLRILDCKEEKCQQLKSEAPQILNNLCDECRNHFKQVLEFIDELNLPYNLNPYLVRGIDYYTNTVFEFFSDDKENGGNKNALGGGGRYDKLVKILGGKDVPGCGAAVGVERVIDLMRDKEQFVKKREIPVFIAQLGDLAKRKSLKIFEQFRKAKINVGESFGRDSLKAQLARANKLGVKYSLIIGQKEALEETIIIRNMENGQQDIVKLDEVVEEIKKRLKK